MTLLPKRKKQWQTAYFFVKCSTPCRKKHKNAVNTHRKTMELAGLTVGGKIVRKRFLVFKSKLFSLKQVFVLTMLVFIANFYITEEQSSYLVDLNLKSIE